ncbi:MAG TPA: shikimate dehydrogenase [Thermodesulfobacteriota bacterium]|nr:shikimate dehydrogenase [Thermodesulfobacteriota bacterium]
MKIDGRTRLVAIFGDPIDHTLSPAIQNAAFEHLGLNLVYVPFHVRPADLKAAVSSIRTLGFIGANITIPHKERVMRSLDDVHVHAKDVGAVNTVVNKKGRLIGYNTDGAGYLLSLREETGFSVRGKKVVILGAGGASRAIFHALLDARPASVVISNRTPKRAADLAREFAKRFKNTTIRTVPFKKGPLREEAQSADLLVNTTSLGMTGQARLDFPVESLPKGAVVSDIVYRPLETGLLKKARSRGLKTHDGLSMLVRQGSIGFELWTGKKAPVELMRKAAKKALGLR